MSLDVVKQPEPVIGWKIVIVEYKRPFWRILSQYDGRKIEPVKAIAHCRISEHNDGNPKVPNINCSCGFYGYKDHDYLGYNEERWIAKVRFYGTVIDCETGYRAEKQDILEIWAPEHNGESAYKWPMRKLEELQEQFPTIKWHFPELPKPAPPVQQSNAGNHEIHVHYPGGDPYDILPKEMIESLNPGMSYQVMMPLTKNYSMGLQLRVQVVNQGLQMEFLDVNNQRVGFLSLTGTKYWWKS